MNQYDTLCKGVYMEQIKVGKSGWVAIDVNAQEMLDSKDRFAGLRGLTPPIHL